MTTFMRSNMDSTRSLIKSRTCDEYGCEKCHGLFICLPTFLVDSETLRSGCPLSETLIVRHAFVCTGIKVSLCAMR